MAEQIREERAVDSDGLATSKTTRVVDDSVPAAADKADGVVIATRVVWFIAGVLLVLLAFRFVFIMLGANPSNGFVDFIYSASHPFAAPFFGIFGYTQTLGSARVEWSTLVAMLVYTLIAWGITRLITIGRPAGKA
jgi:hypothetical protein